MTAHAFAASQPLCRGSVRYGAVVAIAALAVSGNARADAATYSISPGTPNAVVFSVEDNVDPFDGKTARVSGTITADPAAPSGAQVELSVDLGSLDTANGLRNQHMRERYLETSRYPAATFKSVSVAAPSPIAPNAPADISITGDFSLHGVTKRMTIPVKVTLLADGRIHAISNFKVRMPDFGISVPKNLVVTVDDAVAIRLDVFAKPK
jgi:polyisoprenoid-binding protein YceI